MIAGLSARYSYHGKLTHILSGGNFDWTPLFTALYLDSFFLFELCTYQRTILSKAPKELFSRQIKRRNPADARLVNKIRCAKFIVSRKHEGILAKTTGGTPLAERCEKSEINELWLAGLGRLNTRYLEILTSINHIYKSSLPVISQIVRRASGLSAQPQPKSTPTGSALFLLLQTHCPV